MPESSLHVQRQSALPATPANLSPAAGRGELLRLASESNFREEVITIIADPGRGSKALRDVAAMYCEDKEQRSVVRKGGAVQRLACAASACCPEQTVRHMASQQSLGALASPHDLLPQPRIRGPRQSDPHRATRDTAGRRTRPGRAPPANLRRRQRVVIEQSRSAPTDSNLCR
jgi:hypothetical protein